MWSVILRLIIVGLIVFLSASPAWAATTEQITVVATPEWTNGILNFTITYVSETQIDISWQYDGDSDAVKVMIRGKYGEYPDDIPDENTTPSDGFEIYYGTGTSVSWYFDENLSPLYIKAWAQKSDDTWYTDASSGLKDTALLLMSFILFAGVVSYISARTTYYVLKFLAGCVWIVFAIYWINNRPASITQGSATDVAVLVVLIVIGLAFMFMPFWYPTRKDGQEVGGRMRLPFMPSDEEEEAERQRTRPTTRYERTGLYSDRVRRALNGQVRRER